MAYHLDFTDNSKEDIATHKKAGNKAVLNKLLTLFEELSDHPFIGTGKPEPLKHTLSGLWSRRIIRTLNSGYIPKLELDRFENGHIYFSLAMNK